MEIRLWRLWKQREPGEPREPREPREQGRQGRQGESLLIIDKRLVVTICTHTPFPEDDGQKNSHERLKKLDARD